MTAARAANALSLVGTPRSVRALVPIDAGDARIASVRLRIGDDDGVHRAYVRPFGSGTSEIHIRLPRETPPGVYEGEGAIGGERFAIAVEVLPAIKVRVHPKRTHLETTPGGTARFELTVVNRGNVPVEIPKADLVDLDDVAGQDRALGRALRATLGEGERRVDRFFEEIRADHGGQARLAVVEGAGPVAPGETRAIACSFEAPDLAQPGRSYLGSWRIGNAGHAVVVDVRGAVNGRRTG